jgi:hypothetical protein
MMLEISYRFVRIAESTRDDGAYSSNTGTVELAISELDEFS